MYAEKKKAKVMVNGWRSGIADRLQAVIDSESEKHGSAFTKAVLLDHVMGLGLDSFESVEPAITRAKEAAKDKSKKASQFPCTAADDFELFWMAGMVKQNKKKAFSLFKSLAPKNGGSLAFAQMLANDVGVRISARQMGFDAMHPTTYLNGERWNDAPPHQGHISAPNLPDYSGFLGDTNKGVITHE